MHPNSIFYIVGNIFQGLGDCQNVLLFNDVFSQIDTGRLTQGSLQVEQGVSEDDILNLKKLISHKSLDHAIMVTSYFDEVSRCSGSLTHKIKPFNTLISDPQICAEDTYSSLLMIDDRCAECSDHITGKHIQFMVLLEAIRQMGNAVTEKFYASYGKLYLANKITSEFLGFVYPFKTKLIYKVVDKVLKSDGNGKILAHVGVVQWDKKVCQFELDFTVLDRSLVTLLESRSLQEGVTNLETRASP